MSTLSSDFTKKRVDFLISHFETLNTHSSTNNDFGIKNRNQGNKDVNSSSEKRLDYINRPRIHSFDDLDNKIMNNFDLKPESVPTSDYNNSSLDEARARARDVQRRYEKSLSLELSRDGNVAYRKMVHSLYDFGTVIDDSEDNNDYLAEDEENEKDIELEFDDIWKNNQYEFTNVEENLDALIEEQYQIGEDEVFSNNFVDHRYSATSSNFTTDFTDDEECSDNNMEEKFIKANPFTDRNEYTDNKEVRLSEELENNSNKEEINLEETAIHKTDINNNNIDVIAELEMIEKVIFENLQDLEQQKSRRNVNGCEEENKLEIVANSDDNCVELRRPETSDNIYENLPIRRSNRGSQPTFYCVNMIFDGNENMRLKTISPVIPNIRPRSKKDRKEFVIDELIETEYNYIQSLEYVLKNYKPYIEEHSKAGPLVGKCCYIFCNIEKICADSKEFLKDLRKHRNDINEIAKMFQKHKNLFDRYPVYCSNKKKSYNLIIGDFKNIIAKREKQLDEKLGLGSYLLKPIQRLGKYEILLKNLAKYMKADGLNTRYVEFAIDLIVRTTRKSNDILTLGAIVNNPFTFSQTGEFIQLEHFQLISPKKMDMHLFLFRKKVLFTTKDAKDIESYVYYDAIDIDSLSKTVNESDGYVTLENYHTKKRRGGGTYTLTAKDISSKKKWLDIIDNMLWEQLKMCKRQVELRHAGGIEMEKPEKMSVVAVGKKVELTRNKYRSYPSRKDLGRRSKFYRNFST